VLGEARATGSRRGSVFACVSCASRDYKCDAATSSNGLAEYGVTRSLSLNALESAGQRGSKEHWHVSPSSEKVCRDIGCRSERGWPTAATLVTAGALVAVADKHVDAVERDEVAPGLTGPCIVNLFDEYARRLQKPDFLDVTIEAFRPVRGMSLSSDVIEIAERVAAADGHVHLFMSKGRLG